MCKLALQSSNASRLLPMLWSRRSRLQVQLQEAQIENIEMAVQGCRVNIPMVILGDEDKNGDGGDNKKGASRALVMRHEASEVGGSLIAE